MSVLDQFQPHNWSIEDEIRILLKALRRKDVSTAACQQYATEVVRSVVRGWNPGEELSIRQRQKVGAEFDRRLLKTGRKVPRLENPPFKHRQ